MPLSATCTIQFSYTKKYPDEAPKVEIVDSENLEDDESDELEQLMISQVRCVPF